MTKVLTIATLLGGIIVARSLPNGMALLGGGIGAGWWICRYVWWLEESKQRRQCRRRTNG